MSNDEQIFAVHFAICDVRGDEDKHERNHLVF